MSFPAFLDNSLLRLVFVTPVLLAAGPCGAKWTLVDADGDGYSSPEDCNDFESTINPDAPELCDGVDQNCDLIIDDGLDLFRYYTDADWDGYGNPATAIDACMAPSGDSVTNGDDCNDDNDEINPDAAEECNGEDDDCDGEIDNDLPTETYYPDEDDDGYGNGNLPYESCQRPDDYTSQSGDCNDNNDTVNPATTEICNGIDDDCNGVVDDDYAEDALTWYADRDHDGSADPSTDVVACDQPDADYGWGWADNWDCDDSDPTVYRGATEICNGIDDDCNGVVDDSPTDPQTFYNDNDGDGYGDPGFPYEDCTAPRGFVDNSDDCNDDDTSINPAAAEACNGIDDDCNGTVDDDATDATTWYYDDDGDGYGVSGLTQLACEQPARYVANNDDCDDTTGSISPDATEVCDGIYDEDCDGLIDDDDPTATGQTDWWPDSDGDDYGDAGAWGMTNCAEPSGYANNREDCDDTNTDVNPLATEICNEIDDDCDGTADNDAVDTTTWYEDGDGDGYGNPEVNEQACEPAPDQVADSTDCDDSDPIRWDDCDADDDGYDAIDDCDDGDATVYPGATETCDGTDEDCDGTADNYATDTTTWYEDGDGDGYGNPEVSAQACEAAPDQVADSTDCDDSDPIRWDDCDADDDGYDAIDDCDDGDATVYPGAAESCDGMDDDCDGTIDLGASDCPTGCTQDWDGDSAYLFCDNATNWSDARSNCQAYGYDLAIIEDAAEDSYLAATAPTVNATAYWFVGLTDSATEGNFLWVDGSAPAYTNWASGEPDNASGADCGGFFSAYAGWYDVVCTGTRRSICEAR